MNNLKINTTKIRVKIAGKSPSLSATRVKLNKRHHQLDISSSGWGISSSGILSTSKNGMELRLGSSTGSSTGTIDSLSDETDVASSLLPFRTSVVTALFFRCF